MPSSHLDAIDHLIVGVRDLEDARTTYGKLGFNLTPRGRHIGWGTANYCIMFPDDYLELLGIVDPAGFSNGLDRVLDEREGVLGFVFAMTDPEATAAAWHRAGLHPDGPSDLGRALEHGGPDGQMVRFSNVYPAPEKTAGLSFFACRHLTPKLLRQTSWMAHPNGAVGIRSVIWLVPDAAPVVEVLASIVGSAAVTWTDDVAAVHVGRASLLFAQVKDIGMLQPELELLDEPKVPVPVAICINVLDPMRTKKFLSRQQVPFATSADGTIAVAANVACGTAVEFIRA